MMTISPCLPAGLYRRLLGASWNDLDEAVRRLHVERVAVRAAGSFRIRHGSGRLVRRLLWLVGMPSAGEAVPSRLVVTPHGHGEKWLRMFGDRPLVTTQWEGASGLLVERLGILELRFRLEVTGGALNYRQTGVALHLGPVSAPLPRWLAPHVAAWEGPGGGPNRTHVSVHVLIPCMGLLISYEGTMAREEAP